MAVFSLQEVKKLQVQNVIDNNFASWPEDANYGYYGGGYSPTQIVSTIARIDNSTETITAPGNNFPGSIAKCAAISSGVYGYFAGGNFPDPGSVPNTRCNIMRLDFANETVSDPGTNGVPQRITAMQGFSQPSYGYFGGGDITPSAPPSYISTIRKFDFSSETVTNLTNTFSSGKSAVTAVSNETYGYFCGGYDGVSPISTVSRLDILNETVSDPINMPSMRAYPTGVANKSYGYFLGGVAPPFTPYGICTIIRLDFASESFSDPGNDYPSGVVSSSVTSTNSYGYFGGGQTGLPAPDNNSCTITRLDFSTETIGNPGSNLPYSRRLLSAVSGGASIARGNGYRTYGYWAGGSTGFNDPDFLSSIARQDFSTDAISIISSTMQGGPSGHPKSNIGSIQSKNYGYFVGGDGAGTPGTNYGNSSHMTRLDFSNETTRFYPTWHSIGARDIAGSQSAHYGYSAGGYSLMPYEVKGFTPYWLSTLHRVDFDTETTTSPPSLRLTVNMSNGATVESSDNAYFGGGYIGPATVTDQVRKLNFATDTESTSPITLTGQIYTFAGASDNNYGFFGGGYQQYSGRRSQVDRLDFSTETLTPNHTNLSLTKTTHSAVSDTRLYGYYGGGADTSTITCTISRLDFSTGTSNTHSPNFPTIKYNRPGAVAN